MGLNSNSERFKWLTVDCRGIPEVLAVGTRGCYVKTLWHWCWGGSIRNFRSNNRYAIDYLLYAKVGLLNFISYCSDECLKVSGVMNDCCRGCFKSSVCVGISCCGEDVEFLVKLVFEVLHCYGEVIIGDERVEVGYVIHSLNFVRHCLLYGSLS